MSAPGEEIASAIDYVTAALDRQGDAQERIAAALEKIAAVLEEHTKIGGALDLRRLPLLRGDRPS